MSFRELRSFAETMRLLGYPNLISMESFRNPNVELVADCLFWLVKRYEPSAEIVYEIEREADRVFFFKQVCEVALTKGRVKLNIKKLYQSDGNAVQEMLILANILKKAMNTTALEELDHSSLQQMIAQRNVQDAKRVQQLCSDLTNDGSSLFFLIEEETKQRSDRQRVLSRATEVGEFERRLRDVLKNVTTQVEQLQATIVNLGADETTLEQKIESKKTQLERTQKRLKSLNAVRPAFMEEYEKHENDMHSQFVIYLEQYRNLEYLEHELSKFNAAEDALLEEHETKLRVMRERLRKEELNALRGEASRKRGSRSEGDAGGYKGAQANGRDGSSGSGNDRNGRAGERMRDAAVEGSSESESGGESQEEQVRPHGALGRPRPAAAMPSGSSARATLDAYNDSDAAGKAARPGMSMRANSPTERNVRGISQSGAGMSDDDSDSSGDDDDDSDIDTSDISIDSDDSGTDSSSNDL
ncbi:unnamed protein product [Trypanosoma congolense IL3000]|uniref:WGS project CAEQ00000000 data, annotated contig 2228 n=1 Tax=Trypanosoma congolense (strain IL3000) TaxID=1068625 RepID=F9WCG0_TRYCI|nr:unnamed protein product [Trypanosoma congolense IL3000]